MKPSSFCSFSTYNSHMELFTLLLTLSIHHPNEKMYCAVDTKTRDAILSYSPRIKLDIHWFVTLDSYGSLNRTQMVQKKIWDDFQMTKSRIIETTLKEQTDTLFLDADMIILDVIEDIDMSKDIGVSPHYISKPITDKYGYYNGGFLWVKNKNVPSDWIQFTKRSRFHDQASIEDLVAKYSSFCFGCNYNFGQFRLSHNTTRANSAHLVIKDNKIYCHNGRLKTVHTHLNRSYRLNSILIELLTKVRDYKTLCVLSRVTTNKWSVAIPKQPRSGMFNHKNDSFRELALLMTRKHQDVAVTLANADHIYVQECVLLYDRPTISWDRNLGNPMLMLVGNGCREIEDAHFRKRVPHVKPWIFWPRSPIVLEKVLVQHTYLHYDQRNINTIFIGTVTTTEQRKARLSECNWGPFVDEFHCKTGNFHKFTQEQYLLKLATSRYGLCLRGFGSKCHREVELMAFGTVPIITPSVSVDYYMDPLVENVHYVRVNKPEDISSTLKNIDEPTWSKMSRNCQSWYLRNVHSDNCWNTILDTILYK